MTAQRWTKSSYSADNGNCVEVATAPVVTGVRDSKNPRGPVLAFPSARWTQFLTLSSDSAAG
jgi:hypothetical protein